MVESRSSPDRSGELRPTFALRLRRASSVAKAHAAGIAIIVVLAATKLLMIGYDPPIITVDGSLFTDEGWYAKAALLWLRFGELTNELDFTVHPQGPGKTFFDLLTFSLFGSSLFAARAVTIAICSLGLAAYYAIWYQSPYRRGASLAVLAIGINAYFFTYSGLAFTDPLMVSFMLMAICLWVAGRDSIVKCSASLCLASFVALLKLSGVVSFMVVAILWTAVAALAFRRGERAFALRVLALVGLTGAITAGALVTGALLYPADWQFLTLWNIESRQIPDLNLLSALHNIRMTVAGLFHYSGGIAFILVAIAAVAIQLARSDRFHVVAGLRELWRDPVFAAFSVWLFCGLAVHTTIIYHPPRYFLFTVFPVLYIAVAIIMRFGHQLRGPVLGLTAFAYLISQAVYAQGWFKEPFARSFVDSAREIAQLVVSATPGEEGEIVLLGHGFSTTVALFNPRIRPIDIQAYSNPDFCARISRWRPDFMIVTGEVADTAARLTDCGLARDIDLLASYRILDDYRGYGDFELHRIIYR